MKHLLTLLLLGGMVATAQKDDKESSKMKGVYSINYQMLNNGIKDEVLPTKQLKIFTEKYVMYAAKASPTDSLANFGIGTYSINKNKVMENYFYIAGAGDVKDTAELNIEKLANGYKQVIIYPPFKDTIFTLTEKYDKVDKVTKVTPLDGAWKLKSSYYISRDDKKIPGNINEFKIYQNGYFIWGACMKDSATNKNLGYFGYGTFKMNGGTVTEINENTTFMTELFKKPINVAIKFLGIDSYMQTIKYPNGESGVEIYERL